MESRLALTPTTGGVWTFTGVMTTVVSDAALVLHPTTAEVGLAYPTLGGLEKLGGLVTADPSVVKLNAVEFVLAFVK